MSTRAYILLGQETENKCVTIIIKDYGKEKIGEYDRGTTLAVGGTEVSKEDSER